MEFVQNHFSNRWCRRTAQRSFAGSAVRKFDSNNLAYNSVAAANWVTEFICSAKIDLCVV
jgi:hypothetical protein